MGHESQGSLFDALRPSISDARLSTYLRAAGFDEARALDLYLWNVRLGEAFHLSIQAVEVALRNRVSEVLVQEFGSDWWLSERLLAVLDDERRQDLALVLTRIRNRKLLQDHGQVVAGLSFGFWVALLHKKYNPMIWSRHLRGGFPDLPSDRSRKSLELASRRVAQLRNRIWHHEPIIKLDLSAEYGNLMTVLEWISWPKADWIRRNSRVPTLLREKP